MRLPLALAATAGAVALTAPAHAVATPYCSTRLVDAAAGTTASCSTYTQPNLQADQHRKVTLTVATGSATATVACPYDTDSVSVSAGQAPKSADVVDPSGNCRVTLTATSDGTTAVVTSVLYNKQPDPL
ncbi:MAG TPA: hypothetical protein VFQ85_00335 [Mycobacteriales bacterium]|jgi:hypothetical protein|nr:hypothetical protein [Mycobacteriales bacterium]